MTDWTSEIKKRLAEAGGPYHIGHISEANDNRMDVDTESGRCVAEDTFGEYARFIVNAPTDIKNLLGEVERLCAENENFRLEREVLRGALDLMLDYGDFDANPNAPIAGKEALAWEPTESEDV